MKIKDIVEKNWKEWKEYTKAFEKYTKSIEEKQESILDRISSGKEDEIKIELELDSIKYGLILSELMDITYEFRSSYEIMDLISNIGELPQEVRIDAENILRKKQKRLFVVDKGKIKEKYKKEVEDKVKEIRDNSFLSDLKI